MKVTPFIYTDKQIRKKHSVNIIEKYYDILCYLYQNGYDVNCPENEIEEQLEMYNFFKDESDLEELRKVSGDNSTLEIGKKIISEELYDIVKNSVFCQTDCGDNAIKIKSLATLNWEKIKTNTERLKIVFYCPDSEICRVLEKLKNYEKIKKDIDFLLLKINNDIRVLSILKFRELINSIYSIYIKLTKVKTDEHGLVLCSNINSQLYGNAGGYNPNSKEIKCIIGSAVWDLKNIKETNLVSKLKLHAGLILENKSEKDDKYIEYLVRWNKGKETDNNKAKQIIVNCMCNGIFVLLELKYDLNFLDDNRNSKKAGLILEELKSILKYCNIDKNYLL